MPSEMRDDEPSLGKVSFKCPHCGALAHQTWSELLVNKLSKNKNPNLVAANMAFHQRLQRSASFEQQQAIMREASRFGSGVMFLTKVDNEINPIQIDRLANGWASVCISCDQVSIWKADKLIFPSYELSIEPHEDMPDEIKADFREAASIVEISPRGACALLRLCVQKLCVEVGCKGKDINANIAELVKKGLNQQVQEALDIVRVIGNNALHPLEMDLSDDLARARTMLKLVNIIVEELISKPKQLAQLYSDLPEAAREAIARRDKPKQ